MRSLVFVVAFAASIVSSYPTEHDESSTALINPLREVRQARSLTGDFTVHRSTMFSKRRSDEDVEISSELQKRRGGGGGHGSGHGGGGGRGGGRSSAGGRGSGTGGREGGAPGKGQGTGPARGASPHEVAGMKGGRGSGYGLGGRGAGFAGVFLSLAFLSIMFIELASLLFLDATYIYLLTAGVGYELSDTVRYMPGFQNEDTDKWPRYDQRPPTTVTGADGKPRDVTAKWSLRTFSDDSCGDNGNDPYATGKGEHGQPTMMGEIISTDLNYHDGKACENFMVAESDNVYVQSVAVWFDPAYATPPGSKTPNPNQGVISIYSHPLCSTIVDPARTSTNAPNGTIHTVYSDDFPDYMQVYTGLGQRNGDGDDVVGQWTCYQMQANAFHVVFSNITNNKVTLTGPDDTIAAADTLPPAGKAGEQDVFADRGGGTFLTTDITKTYQVPPPS